VQHLVTRNSLLCLILEGQEGYKLDVELKSDPGRDHTGLVAMLGSHCFGQYDSTDMGATVGCCTCKKYLH
jgi:hypothetical protein